ncbi:MAG: tetratricopeptide repeat protein [Gammaproteobacteria bacterium]|nr:tetratricopeptide repeat protein [Gammaproteobacteria bacterium]
MLVRIFTLLLLLLPLITGCATLDRGPQYGLVEAPVEKIYPLEITTPIENDPVYQLVVAELAVNRGQTETAIDNYLALAISQDDPKLAERAVRIAVFGQDLNAAQVAAERWIELEPKKIEAQQIIAAIFIRQGNADQAYYYVDEVIKTQDDIDDQTFISLLNVLAREQNTETVLRVSKRLADNYSGFAYAHFLHGSLASRADLAQESLDYLDNALAIKDIPDAHAIRAKMLIKVGKREEAVISLKRAVLSKPENKQLRLAYARLLVDLKEYERARTEFEKLHLMAPNDPDLLYTLGLLSLESQRFDSAEKYLLKLLGLNKRIGEAQYYLGRINESRNQYQQAIDWYQKVNTGEYRFDAQIRSANLLAKSGDTDNAIQQLKKMAEGSQSKASLVRIYLAKGEILKEANRYQDAIEIYNQALKVIPGNIDLLYARGLTAERIDNLELLEQDMRTILTTEPDNAHALNALGFTLADRTDRLQEAYQLLQRAIEIKPEDPAIIDSYGWINYRLGNYDEAIRLLKKALSQFEDGEIAAHLGEVLWVTGRQEEALGIWERALQKSPEDPFVLKTMERFQQR